MKIASSAPSSSCEGEFSDIRLCLSVLLFCSSEDSVAARFHETLFSIYESLLNQQANQTVTIAPPHLDTGRHDAPELLESSGSLTKLSDDLLTMLCQPFGGPINREGSKECLDISYKTSSSRNEHQYLMEKLEWEFEDSALFQCE